MADDLHYVPGDFYRLDDRSGFKVRARRMRMEWTQLIVDKDLFELRPAQDFVKGVIDDQTVPLPRPRPAQDPFVAWLQTTLTAKAGAGAHVIQVASTAGMMVGDTIEIMLDTNELFRTTIVGQFNVPEPFTNFIYFQNIFLYQLPAITKPQQLTATSITIANPLPYSASIGNIIEDLTQSKNVLPDNEDFLT